MTEGKTVFVGLSGGVDSSVAALRLKHAGYTVVGVFIKVWHPDFLTCNWEAERLDAMRVAAHLDIPFLTCDAEAAYKRDVADYFIREYKAGRTPNPDVMCNKAVKFGAFLEFAKNAGADYIATGHYAQNIATDNQFELHRGIDTDKDQSYFLWTLTQQQLQHVLLPVGDTNKSEIRREAAQAGIPVSTKKDSQGICFLGHIDIPEFLSHYITLTPGSVLDPSGQSIGTHKGAVVYTRGQRHGFTISDANTARNPHYVIDKDIEGNTITVDTTPPVTTSQTHCTLTECNWIGAAPAAGSMLEAQFRYRQKPFTVTVIDSTTEAVIIKLIDTAEVATPGQSCVLYDGMCCLGGGIIAG